MKPRGSYQFALPAPRGWRTLLVMCALAGIALGAMNHHDEPAELAVGVGFPITALAALLGSEQTRLRRIIVWSVMFLGFGLFALGAYLQAAA